MACKVLLPIAIKESSIELVNIKMGGLSTCIGIFVVVVAVLFSSPPTTEADFRKFLIKGLQKDSNFFESTLRNPLKSLRHKLSPVQHYSFGCSSFVYYDTNYFIGFKKRWINIGSVKGLTKKVTSTLKKSNSEDFSNLFIGTNIVIFILWQFSYTRPFMKRHFLCSMENICGGRVWCIFLNNVSHQDFFHLMINMSSFYTFLPVLWSRKSIRYRLPMLMAGSGLTGTFVSLFYFNIVKGWRHQLHGASAIVSGLTTILALLFPNRTFVVYGFPVKAMQLLIIQLLIELYRMANVQRVGVDFASHLGGMIFAVTYYNYNYY